MDRRRYVARARARARAERRSDVRRNDDEDDARDDDDDGERERDDEWVVRVERGAREGARDERWGAERGASGANAPRELA